jgi:histidinol dehydrogenase
MSDYIPILSSKDPLFNQQLEALLAWHSVSDQEVLKRVQDIIVNVKKSGDAALLGYTEKFDGFPNPTIEALTLNSDALQHALESISPEQRLSLHKASERIRDFHLKQVEKSWTVEESNGNVLGQKITPISRIGVYVPGGKASYPSSVLMNVIPAKVAGVKEIIMVTPAMGGQTNDIVLAAAALAGVDKVMLVGGAQAIAALAYGTASIPKVDKITGPGNIYVATAKREVFGQVGIDMIAGPSEILIICDGKTNPDWIAMDLFSQAEHDESAQAILISDDLEFLKSVYQSIEKLLPNMERKDIISKALSSRGAMIHVSSIDEAITLSNRIAPEHLELSCANAKELLDDVSHAGAVFVGRYTAEALGDYCAGPNHVLPTSGTARFSSPLGVYDFQKRTSIIHCSEQGAHELGIIAASLAKAESLTAHAQSALYRVNSET